MEYTYMGKTGLKVSRLCLGTMNFGPNTDEKESFRIMDCALEAGINFFDTANMYGGRNGGKRGWTEEIIGRWFAQGGGRREKVVLATKVFEPMENGIDGPNDEPGLSGYKIRRHLEASLKRMQTDHLELYYMHNPAPHATWDELWGTFEPLVSSGVVDYIGCSNFAAYQIAIGQAEAAKRHFLGLTANQAKYNLLCRLPELELIPASQELGLGFMCWGPLQGGMLSGSLFKDVASGQRSGKYVGSLSPERLKQLEDYRELCHSYGQDEATVSMAWLLNRPGVTAPLVGPRTVEQLEDSLKVLEWKMPAELEAQLDILFPGPGASAPKAYMMNR